MEPIISPWFFYFVDVVPSFRVIFIFLGLVSVGTAIYYIINYIVDQDMVNLKVSSELEIPYGATDEEIETQKGKLKRQYGYENNKNKKKSIYYLGFGTVILLIGLLIPSQITLYKMMIASMVTPDNLSATGEVIDKGINYIGNLSQSSLQTLLDMIVEAANKIK